MRHVYMAFSMTGQNGAVAPMKALACWLRKFKKYKVFEPKYELFPEMLAKQAISRLDSSFLVIADVTHPSNGVGFEIGYAFSKDKSVIIVAQEGGTSKLSKFSAFDNKYLPIPSNLI